MQKVWDHSVMVYIIGEKPLNFHFQRYIKAQWPSICPVQIHPHKDGYFILRLSSEEECLKILEGGLYFTNKKVVIVKRWSHEFDFRGEVLRKLPLWFRLPSLPLVCWGADSLSWIRSILGIPCCAD